MIHCFRSAVIHSISCCCFFLILDDKAKKNPFILNKAASSYNQLWFTNIIWPLNNKLGRCWSISWELFVVYKWNYFLIRLFLLLFDRTLVLTQRSQAVNFKSLGTTPKNWKVTLASCRTLLRNSPPRTGSYASGTRTSLKRFYSALIVS